ncbi:Delphilin [Mytilus edulis]|uniref:Delphilin n=1 Tax=Mytilus edulis TaxID=6550 RepID=A0A8S3R8K8_MYTED|nr:Delphilin [Mytilus edulis]
MNVKRINWEKIDAQKVGNTVWGQLGDEEDLDDVLKYLELEQHFSTNPVKLFTEKKNEIYILSPKKAYNISILLGHLRMSIDQMKQALYLMDEEILTPDLLKQLLTFTPNKQEMEKYDTFNGDIEELSLPDRFAYEMSRVPGYEQRLKSILFKANFQEKIDDMKESLLCIRKGSLQLRNSKRLTKILEMILAMGNYMNKGNQRVGEAAGFKISFISQLEVTKTSDNKTTFLHVLANAVYVKFPEVLAVGEELSSIPEAAKVSDIMVNQEIQELRKVLQVSQIKVLQVSQIKVLQHFISEASDEVQALFRLQANAMEDFHHVVQYFGEDPKNITTTEFFGIFADFIIKFEINVSSLDFVSCNDQANNILNRKAACDFEEPSSRDFNVCIRCCRDWKSPTALWTS